MAKIYVYIDGFNFYYGSLKGSPYKWLNPLALCEHILPGDEIVKIKYFTARVAARANDMEKPQRQKMYLRALATIPNLEIIYGKFLTNVCRMPLARPPASGSRTVEVIKTDEKGSDVNLASHLLVDAFEGKFETAIVISNDSDLVTPINFTKSRYKKPVGVLIPGNVKNPSYDLNNIASFIKTIRVSALQYAQFDPVLTDAKGSFHKPTDW